MLQENKNEGNATNLLLGHSHSSIFTSIYPFQVSTVYISNVLFGIFKCSVILTIYAINRFIYVHCTDSHSLQQHVSHDNHTNTIQNYLQLHEVSIIFILYLMFSFYRYFNIIIIPINSIIKLYTCSNI